MVTRYPPTFLARAQQSRDGAGGLRGQFLVRVEHQHPVGGDRGKRGVAGVGEIVVPGKRNEGGPEFRGYLASPIGRAGVGDDHLIDQRPRTLQTGPEVLLRVAHDHGQSEGGHEVSWP